MRLSHRLLFHDLHHFIRRQFRFEFFKTLLILGVGSLRFIDGIECDEACGDADPNQYYQ